MARSNGDLVAKARHGGQRVGLAGEPRRARGRLRAQRVLIHQRDLEAALRQVVSHRKPGLPPANDQRLYALHILIFHDC